MRYKFGDLIFDLAKRDSRCIVITGDIGFRVFDSLRENFPDRFLNIGICEQSMIGVAAGMSMEGWNPWVYTITPFLIERPFEQIKLDIDNQKANVKLVGYADYPTLGPTHSELDAKVLMSLLKNINSYFPNTINDLCDIVSSEAKRQGPAFISLKELNKMV